MMIKWFRPNIIRHADPSIRNNFSNCCSMLVFRRALIFFVVVVSTIHIVAFLVLLHFPNPARRTNMLDSFLSFFIKFLVTVKRFTFLTHFPYFGIFIIRKIYILQVSHILIFFCIDINNSFIHTFLQNSFFFKCKY